MASSASTSVEQLRHQTHIPSRHLIGCQNVSMTGVLLAAPLGIGARRLRAWRA